MWRCGASANASAPGCAWVAAVAGAQVALVGLVEELLAESDPEYHWSDNFRTSRFSNEERQRTFLCISGRLRRLVGRKVLEMVRRRTHRQGAEEGGPRPWFFKPRRPSNANLAPVLPADRPSPGLVRVTSARMRLPTGRQRSAGLPAVV